MWIVIYYAYGVWKVASAFPSEKSAQQHITRYISTKDYNKFIEIRYIELPAEAPPFDERQYSYL